MIFELIQGNVTKLDIAMILLTFPVVLISLCFHELAHGYIAKKLGDPTAEWHGRLTMNPLKHLDPLGTLAMLLFGYGWAKPVPVNPRYFKNPKKGMALVGLAGPLSNLILAFVSLFLLRVLGALTHLNFWFDGSRMWYVPGIEFKVADFISIFLTIFTSLNVCLAVFNLIPIPPFDGSRIFYFLLPDKYYFSVMRYERQIMTITMILLFSGIVSLPLDFLTDKIIWLYDFIIGLVPGL